MHAAGPSQLPLLLYDGYCALCTGLVQSLLNIDRREVLYFAPLHSVGSGALERQHPELAAFAKTSLASAGIDLSKTDSVVLIDRTGAYIQSSAILRLAKHIGWPWRMLGIGQVLPKGWRDTIYQFVAQRRYAWFGQRDSCWLPKAGWRERILGE